MKSNHDYARGLAEKAEHDFQAATEGLEHGFPLDVICFHLQQAVEKLLKALLVVHGADFPLTHELDALLALAIPLAPELESFRDRLRPFASYAVEMRYDSSLYPRREEAVEALETVMKFRSQVYALLPPEVLPPDSERC